MSHSVTSLDIEFWALRPMLLAEVSPALAPDGDDWTVQVKMDGYRLLALISVDGVRLLTRNGNDATQWYPELQSLSQLPPGTVIDGEVAVLDELGRSDFERTHRRSMRRGQPAGSDPVVFCAFDVLFLKGKDLREGSLKKRLATLERLLKKPPASVLFMQHIPGKIQWLYQQALALELEGVVAKRLDSPYLTGQRSSFWLKIKRPGAVPAQRFRR